jgi:hypothetical protein
MTECTKLRSIRLPGSRLSIIIPFTWNERWHHWFFGRKFSPELPPSETRSAPPALRVFTS